MPTPPTARQIDAVLHAVYEAYADLVLKNPFYELEMPIRCQLFTDQVNQIISQHSAQPKSRNNTYMYSG